MNYLFLAIKTQVKKINYHVVLIFPCRSKNEGDNNFILNRLKIQFLNI